MTTLTLDARRIMENRRVILPVTTAVTPSGAIAQQVDGVFDIFADADTFIVIESSAAKAANLTVLNGYKIPLATNTGSPMKFVVPAGYQIYAITAAASNLHYERIGDAA